MNGEVLCQRRSVSLLSCSSPVVEDRPTLRLTQEAEVIQQQEEAQQEEEALQQERRSTEGWTPSNVSSKDLKVDLTKMESWSSSLPSPPPQLLPPSPLHNNNNNNNNSSQRRGGRTKTVGRKNTRKMTVGKVSQSRKVTDFYPIRRSSRKSKTEQNCEQKKLLDHLIINGIEEGMEVQHIEGKGRAVFATRPFQKGEFVVEYHGDLLHINDAKQREAEYAQNPATGCYMYYFQYLCKTYCVDATRESGRLGRLINHSKNGNCQTKLHDIDGVPHLILVASREVERGEELLYDYGDRSKASIDAHPWLKY